MLTIVTFDEKAWAAPPIGGVPRHPHGGVMTVALPNGGAHAAPSAERRATSRPHGGVRYRSHGGAVNRGSHKKLQYFTVLTATNRQHVIVPLRLTIIGSHRLPLCSLPFSPTVG